MAYKVFAAPTGSGKVVFEGDVINGWTSRDTRNVRLQFFSNDRGYTAAAFQIDREGAKRLREELGRLLDDPRATATAPFSADSQNKNFRLMREFEGTPLILVCNGSDLMQGRSFHRGDLAVMQKVCAELDTVLKSLDEVQAGKGPEE